MEADYERMIGVAWHIEAFRRQNKLRPLASYLSRRGPRGDLPDQAELEAKIDAIFGPMVASAGVAGG